MMPEMEQGEFSVEELDNIYGGRTYASEEDLKAYEEMVANMKGFQPQVDANQQVDSDELTVEDLDQVTAGVPGKTL